MLVDGLDRAVHNRFQIQIIKHEFNLVKVGDDSDNGVDEQL